LNAINLGLSFNPASPAPTYTINWLPVPPAGVSNFSQTLVTGGIVPATYTAVITAAGGCSTTTVAVINPPPAPSQFTVTPNPNGSSYVVTCIQPTITLDANPSNYTYNWSNNVVAPQTGSTTNYNQFALGNWTVIGTHPVSGCVSSKVFTVTLNQTVPSSNAAPTNQNITCGPGVVVTVTGTAVSPTVNVTHCWYSPGIDVPTCGGGEYSIFSLGAPGTYTHVLTDNVNGCTTTKTVQVVSSLGFPTYSVISPQSFTVGCASRSVALVNIVNQNTQPNPGGALSYTVLPPGFNQPSYSYSTTFNYSLTTPGNYTFITRDNANQCETRIVVPIIQDIFPPDIGVNVATRTLTCRTPSTILEGVSTTTNVGYSWTFLNGSNPNTILSSTTISQTSTNTAISATVVNVFTLTVLNNNNQCRTSSVVPMYQNIRPPRPSIVGAAPLDCITFERTLVNNSSLDEAPGFFAPLGTAAIRWDGPSPQEPNVDTISNYKAKTVGIYTMTVMDRNNGCITQTTTSILDNKKYPVLNTNTLVALDCGASLTGVSLSVTAVNLKPADVTAVWTAPFPTPNIKNANTLTLTTDGVGDYRLTVTTNSNGCAARIYVKVINGVLNGGFTADQESGFAPLTVNFSNTSASSSSVTGTSSITSVWSFGNGSTRTTSTNVGTSAVYNQPGTYTVTMFASKGTCSDTVQKVIFVDIPSKMVVPNVFTPNGDNSNDVFFIKAANLSEISAVIYDRWGNKVYELTTSKGNIAWDGKNLTGKEAPDGTYFYIITAKGTDGQTYDTKGTVSLYR
jgi:gliding motility-associated-like protein